MVLRGRHQPQLLAVAEGQHGQFRAEQSLFDKHHVAGVSKAPLNHDAAKLGECLSAAFRQKNAFASGQSAGLDYRKGVQPNSEVGRTFEISEDARPAGWDGMAVHKGFGECLRSFQLGRGSAGTEYGQPFEGKPIGKS